MRHNKNFNHLGRQSSHRKALMSNMASSLILHKRIETTVAKAKENIVNIVDTTPKYAETKPSVVEDDDLTESNVSDDDDAWVDAILNS